MASSDPRALAPLAVLVVEDEYFIADDMACVLESLGAKVVGPVPTRDGALAVIRSGERIDFAVLDINLQGETVFPVADTLAQLSIPFVFATGYDVASVPPAYRHVVRWEKPFNPKHLAKALPGLLARE